MSKSDELVKFITEKVVSYIDTPKETRKQHKIAVSSRKEQWQYRWFGMLPFALRMWFDQWRDKKK